MVYTQTNGYEIRNYSENDADKIGMFNKILELSYRYNPDFIPENIFCAINSDGDILGVGHIELHDTWNLINKDNVLPGFVYKLKIDISINTHFTNSDTMKKDLLKMLLKRSNVIKKQYPEKNIRVFTWLSSEDYDEIDFLLSNGFIAFQNSLVMKYDLSQEIPEVLKPEGITVAMRKMESEAELIQYHEAESIAFSGITWSLNLLRWHRGGPEWMCFSVFYENLLIGSTMTWMITEERSAVENIFVLPEWRNKSIAKYMITEALKYLKSQRKSIATLSVHGDNKPAISLYKSLGFRMFGIMIEFGYDV